MSTPTTFPSSKQWLGMAKETVQGTAVTPATSFMPIGKFQPKDDPVWLEDRALRGSMAGLHGVVQGPQKSTFSGDGILFLDNAPHLLLNILGELATTGPVSSIYTHAISLLNSGTGQPPSHTFTHWQGLTATTRARTYSGCCLSELVMKGNAESGFVETTYKGSGFWSAAYPTSEPTPTFTADTPLAAWRVELAFGGALPGAKKLVVRDWEVSIKRKIAVQHTSQNSQAPYIIQRGDLEVDMKFFVSKPSDETFLDYMRSNTQPQFQLSVSNGAAGAAARSLTIDAAAAAFDSAEHNFGDEAIGLDCTVKCVANTTNVGASGGRAPAKFTITNATSTY